MLAKYLVTLLVVNFGLVAIASAATPIPTGSNNLSVSTPTPKKKIIFIDYANTVKKSFNVGCGANYIAVGVSGMPTKTGTYSKSTPIDHEKYKFDITRTEAACVWVKMYWSEYESFDPSWVSGFNTPLLTCAPITVKWQ